MRPIKWQIVIPAAAFAVTLWLLQGQLSSLYDAAEATCNEMTGCAREITVAYGLLSLSTLVSAAGIAWASYRLNTALSKPDR